MVAAVIERHFCLERNTIQLGESWDCPKCWAVLITSLGPDADSTVSEEDLSHSPGVGWGPVPEEIQSEIQVPVSSSCNPRTCAYCGKPRGRPGCTFCKTEIRKYMSAGRWSVWCTGCYWTVEGIYEPSETETTIGRAHV